MNFLKNNAVYLIAILVAILVIVYEIFAKPSVPATQNNSNEVFDYEAAIKEQMENSIIRINDQNYYGEYNIEGYQEIPAGYELAGTIKSTTQDIPTENLSSNSISQGIEVYTSSEDTSTIYIKVDYEGTVVYSKYSLKG